jgi:TonB family protein
MNSKHWAILVTILYGGAVALALLYGAVEFDVHTPKEAELFIELVEPKPDPVPVVAQSRPSPKPEVAPHHPQPAEQESTQQVSGEEPKTQTVNQRALFKMNNGEAETAEKSGNPLAQKGEKEQSSGTSHGLNPIGTDALDEGLQGRGLAGELPMPTYPGGNKGGKVVVRVAVDKNGKVTSATFEPTGSTTSDSALVEAAIAAAKRARFTESAAFMQGGTITYIFKLKAEK